jgi:hypothetical protein
MIAMAISACSSSIPQPVRSATIRQPAWSRGGRSSPSPCLAGRGQSAFRAM